MHQVFLSYSHRDTALVERVYADLLSKGLTVWFDKDLIPGMDDWNAKIQRAIEAATCLVVLLSPNAKPSKWIEREHTYAEWQGVPIIAALLTGDPSTAVPIYYSNFLLINLRREDDYPRGLEELVKAVNHYKARFQNTDLVEPQTLRFLERSNLHLLAIDTAIVSWYAPRGDSDWGWKSDDDISFVCEENLLDTADLADELRMVVGEYGKKNPDKEDSVRYCVTEFHTDPDIIAGKLHLTVSPVKYLTTYPICATLLDNEASRGLRQKFYVKLDDRTTPLIPNILGMLIVVITGDGKLLFTRRKSKYIDFLTGRWTASVDEQLNGPWRKYMAEDEVYKDARETDESIFNGFSRALQEEVQLTTSEISQSVLRILGVGFATDSFNTFLYAMAELPLEVTSEKLDPRLTTSGEFDDVTYCNFDPGNLKPFVRNGIPPQDVPEEKAKTMAGKDNWDPASRLRVALAIRRKWGEEVFWQLFEP